MTVFADALSAAQVSFGRTNTVYVNPYSGDVKEATAVSLRGWMRTLTEWHRWLGRDGEGREVGKAITGACNAAFLFLTISGLVLWAPRAWSWASVRAVAVLRLNARGKARDWNWHNVLGFWSSPVLIVLTLSGMVISYRWAGDLVYKIAGSPVPAAAGPGGMSSPAPEVPKPEPGQKPLTREAQLLAAQKEFPNWEQITFRLGGGGGGEGRRPEGAKAENAKPQTEPKTEANVREATPPTERASRSNEKERSEGRRAGGRENEGGERRAIPQAVSLTIRERGGWPMFASTQVWLDPFTGAVLRKEAFSDFNTGRRARMWLRFLHTGEAFGVIGKTVAAAACVGGAVLVWTGFALAIRRFLNRKKGSVSGSMRASEAEPATLSQ